EIREVQAEFPGGLGVDGSGPAIVRDASGFAMHALERALGKIISGAILEAKTVEAERLESLLEDSAEVRAIDAATKRLRRPADAYVVRQDAATDAGLSKQLAKFREFDIVKLLDAPENADARNDQHSCQCCLAME